MLRNLFIIFSVLACSTVSLRAQQPLVTDQPKDISIPNIIQAFAAKEKEFQEALQHYSYTENVAVKGTCPGGHIGYYHLVVDVSFNKKGRRQEKVKAADSTLQCVMITKEDLDSFRSQSLLLLTTDELQSYHINFIGQQSQGNLPFYVFDVSPIKVSGDKQYFAGRIWVDGHDLLIVRTRGTMVNEQGNRRYPKTCFLLRSLVGARRSMAVTGSRSKAKPATSCASQRGTCILKNRLS